VKVSSFKAQLYHLFQKRRIQRAQLLSYSNLPTNKISGTALLIYVPWAIKEWINKTYKEENYNGHSMHWESVEMVKILAKKGYWVDIVDCTKELPLISWTKYSLIIDERNNLKTAPEVAGQIRIFYSTGCHWLFHNTAEYQRLFDFRCRNGLSLKPERQIAPIFSDEIANYTTYFGGEFQRLTFTNPKKVYPLDISSTFVPEFQTKNVEKCRKDFLWLGSRGFIHKGLDIVLEAFKNSINFNLHICTNLEAEPEFYRWYKNEFGSCQNISYHGWKSVFDESFKNLAEKCIGTVYCSAAEGGAGATIQAMQFGCIPLVNQSTALKGQSIGYCIAGQTPSELISALREMLLKIDDIPNVELLEKSSVVRTYANKNHSKDAYSISFKRLIDCINNE